MKRFSKGEKVIYGAHGVGVVNKVVEKEIQGQKLKFYEIFFEDSNSKIFIPVERIDRAGVRKLIEPEEIKEVFSKFQSPVEFMDISDWKSRYRENLEKVKSGNIFQIAEVIRDLSLLNRKKPLSMRERELLEKAKKIFVDEISEVKNTSPDEIRKKLDSLLKEGKDLI